MPKAVIKKVSHSYNKHVLSTYYGLNTTLKTDGVAANDWQILFTQVL